MVQKTLEELRIMMHEAIEEKTKAVFRECESQRKAYEAEALGRSWAVSACTYELASDPTKQILIVEQFDEV